MRMRLALVGALALTSIGASLPVAADVNVVVRVAPPAARVEVVPAPRVGYVWAPGHWVWRDGRHLWIGGLWIRERPGMHWHPSRWVHHDGQWRFVAGGWAGQPYVVRDRDGDGVPNRLDRDRDNDGVRNRADRDRDGDGVRNRRDARPNNPNRR